jgi:hypothetical protein
MLGVSLLKPLSHTARNCPRSELTTGVSSALLRVNKHCDNILQSDAAVLYRKTSHTGRYFQKGNEVF